MRSIHRQVLLSTAVVIGAGWAPLLCAQEMAPGTGDPRQAEPTAGDEQAAPGDIIVTAQRRSQSIQNIPLAIQAVEGDTLISAGVLQVSQLSTVSPSFVYSASGGEPTIGLRGIGGELSQIAAEPSVSLSLDGVPLLRQQYFLGSFFDVERVEVLRGPQGTIAGRNATGGAVNIITRKPTERLEGGLDATYGNFGTFNIGMWASGPVVADTLAAHFAIERRKSDGYVTSSITGERLGGHDDILARVALLAKPAEGIELLLSGDYFNSQDNSPAYVGLGLYDPENVAAVIDPPGFGSAPAYDRDTRRAEIAGLPGERELFTQRSQGVNLQGSFELGAGTMLKTITGYRELKGDQRYESVRGPVPINPIYTPYAQHQFSQEATLTSSFGDAVDILIGGQYLDETARQQTSVIYLRGLASPDFAGAAAVDLTAHDQIKLRSIAAFGQMEWRLAPTLQLTVGGRYTSDRKTYRGQLSIPAQTPPLPPPFGPDIRQRATFNKFTPRIALDWKPSDRVTAYASWSQGFKAGGFGTAGALTPGFGPFEPETVNNYELGLKTNSFDRRLTANLTGFWADYKNLQYPFYVAPATIITNAGKARVRGVELELGYHPSRALDLSFNATYLDAKYVEFDAADPGKPSGNAFCADPTSPAFGLCLPIPGAVGTQDLAGNRLPKAPKLSLAATASYRVELGSAGALALRGDLKYQTKVYYSAFNLDRVAQNGYALVNLRATFDVGATGLSISGYARNIFDKSYFIGKTQLGSNLAGLDPRLPGTVVGGVPLNLLPVSTLGGIIGEPRSYGVTASFSF